MNSVSKVTEIALPKGLQAGKTYQIPITGTDDALILVVTVAKVNGNGDYTLDEMYVDIAEPDAA